MAKYNKWMFYVGVSVVLIVASLNWRESLIIRFQESHQTFAVIFEEEPGGGLRCRLMYRYLWEENLYEKHVSVIQRAPCNEISIGQVIRIEISANNPRVSKIDKMELRLSEVAIDSIRKDLHFN